MKKLFILLMVAMMSFGAFAQEETAAEAYHAWELSLVRISFVADVGVQIPWIANASLQPQFEFIWR